MPPGGQSSTADGTLCGDTGALGPRPDTAAASTCDCPAHGILVSLNSAACVQAAAVPDCAALEELAAHKSTAKHFKLQGSLQSFHQTCWPSSYVKSCRTGQPCGSLATETRFMKRRQPQSPVLSRQPDSGRLCYHALRQICHQHPLRGGRGRGCVSKRRVHFWSPATGGLCAGRGSGTTWKHCQVSSPQCGRLCPPRCTRLNSPCFPTPSSHRRPHRGLAPR